MPLLLVAAIDFVMVRRVELIRDLIVEQSLPVTLDTFNMRAQLQNMNSNLLEYVLGEVEEESEYYQHLNAFTEIRKKLNEKVIAEADLKDLDRLLDIAANRASDKVFSFDASTLNKSTPKVLQLIQSYVDPISFILDQHHAIYLAQISNSEIDEAAKKYELNNTLGIKLASAVNALKLLAAKNPDASSDFIISIYQFETALDALNNIEQSDSMKIGYTSIRTLIKKLSEKGISLIEEADIDGYFDAVLTIEEIERHYFPKSDSVLRNISDRSRKEVESSLDELQKATKTFERANFSAIFCVIGFTIVYLIYLRRTIIFPIRQISTQIHQLRNGSRNIHFDESNSSREISDINSNLDNLQHAMIELDKLRHEQLDQVQKQHLKELKKANQQLHGLVVENDAANEKLSSANKDLAQFVHIASHDLREPLKKLGSLCAILEEETSETSDNLLIRDITDKISNQASSACQLIDDLRTLASLDHTDLKHTQTSLDDIVKEVISELAHVLEGRVSSIEIAPLPTLDLSMVLIKQVFVNLVRNAILHSTGAFFMAITAERIDSEQCWRFTVSNSTENTIADPKRLFLPFVKGKNSVQGTGMGLAICKKIIEIHSGTIWVENSNEKKFVVKFTLPLIPQDHITPASLASEPS